MKIRLTILCFFIYSIGIQATNISGTISANMTLDSAGSPWVVTSNVTVNAGVTLLVDSGVVVQFNPSRHMTVHGTLDADYATFTSVQSSPASGDWQSINVYGTVNLDDCIVEYGNRALNLYGGNVNLTNCTISDSYVPILYSASSDLTESNTSFINNNFQYVESNMSIIAAGENISLPSIAIPYVINYDLVIEATASIAIAAPNILKFNGGVGVSVDGVLNVSASLGNEVIWTSYSDDNAGGDSNNDGSSTSPNSGDWGGIEFRSSSNDALCNLEYCEIKYGGYQSDGGISCIDASPTIKNCDISNNYYGIKLTEGANPTIDSCVIGSSSVTPIAMSFDANPTFTNNSFSFSDNTYDAIGILGSTLTANSTISKRDVTGVPNVTYVLLNQVTIPSGITLTIDPGVVIKSLYAEILVYGELLANATMTDRIIFTSVHDDNHGNPKDTNKNGNTTAPNKGNWQGIVFGEDGSSASILNYCTINYGSTSYVYLTTTTHPYTYYTLNANIAIIKSNPTISNCETNISDHGIVCYNDAAPTLTNNSIVNASSTPIAITADSDPIASGNTFTNAGLEAMGLIGTIVTADGTISKIDLGGYTNITYVLIGGSMIIEDGAYIDVEPGVVIKSDGAGIRVDGGFKAVGNNVDEIVFTSTKDDNEGNPMDTNGDGNSTSPNYYDWQGIVYTETSDDAFDTLKHIHLKYASSQFYYNGYNASAGVHFHSADGYVSESTFSGCNRGLAFTGNSSTVTENTLIETTQDEALAMSLSANPQFNNLTFNSNNYNTIGILDATLSSNATLSPRSVAGIANIAYSQISNLTINENFTLTIDPGVVWKNQNKFIYVRGGLNAVGTAMNKIVFTSIYDDSAGGDSNNDGNSSVPTVGQGGGILFYPESIDANNKVQYCDFRYSGYTTNWTPKFENSERYGVLKIKNCHVDIQDCQFGFISFYGIGIYGSANPSLVNNEFSNIDNTAINMAMFSSPTFSGNTAFNLGYMALDIVNETYSQSGVVPIRSFANYDTITYVVSNNVIANGSTIEVPAGIVFKSMSGYRTFDVYGQLELQGTSTNPVIMTDIGDDDYGNPKDSRLDGQNANIPLYGNYIWFRGASDDNSLIQHARFRYANNAIYCESAAPTIENCNIEYCTNGIRLVGASAPKILNSTFHNLARTPLIGSILNAPDTTFGNVISGTTWKGLGVITETLTQDFTLKKRNFAGQHAIPYVFENTYTVGTGAVLTIDTGVICKFAYLQNGSEYLTVQRGLNVNGGKNPGQQVVFTSITDDFYGGDTNADGPSEANYGEWGGLNFKNESIDALCDLNNLVIRSALYGIQCENSSPTIKFANIQNNSRGVYSTGSSNPVFDSCQFVDNYSFAIQNLGTAFTIKAENCYWGDCSGPTHASNPAGTGEVVSDYVDFDPWSCELLLPLTGDVSLNGAVQAYDAALILQYLASLISLTGQQQSVADVSGEAGISAYDASLILQFNVGLINAFPVESTNRNNSIDESANAVLDLGVHDVSASQELMIPLNLKHVENLQATEILLTYNPHIIEVLDLTLSNVFKDMQQAVRFDEPGVIRIFTADINPIYSDGLLGMLSIKISDDAVPTREILKVKSFIGNETTLTPLAIDGVFHIDAVSGIGDEYSTAVQTLEAYPNPFSSSIYIKLPNTDNAKFIISLSDISGKMWKKIEYQNTNSSDIVEFVGLDDLPDGAFIVTVYTNENVHSKLIQHLRN